MHFIFSIHVDKITTHLSSGQPWLMFTNIESTLYFTADGVPYKYAFLITSKQHRTLGQYSIHREGEIKYLKIWSKN